MKANHPLGCIENEIASWVREGIDPLCSALLQPHLEQGDLVNSKLGVSQQCAQASRKDNRPLGCIESDITSWVREGIVPLCSALLQPRLEHWVHCWSPQNIKDVKLL